MVGEAEMERKEDSVGRRGRGSRAIGKQGGSADNLQRGEEWRREARPGVKGGGGGRTFRNSGQVREVGGRWKGKVAKVSDGGRERELWLRNGSGKEL